MNCNRRYTSKSPGLKVGEYADFPAVLDFMAGWV
jgi:hypothetical protein